MNKIKKLPTAEATSVVTVTVPPSHCRPYMEIQGFMAKKNLTKVSQCKRVALKP